MATRAPVAGTFLPLAPVSSTTRGVWVQRGFLVLLALLPLAVFRAHYDDRLVYLHCGLMDLLSAGFCWYAGRRAPAERVRWYLFAACQGIGSIGYFAPWLRDFAVITYQHAAWASNLTIAVSRTLFIPTLLGSRLGRGTLVRGMDAVLVMLCSAMLMFALGSGRLAAEGPARVWTSLLSCLLLCLLSACAGLVHERAGLRHFMASATSYLFVTTLCGFLINIVLDLFPAAPDVIANACIPLPALLLCAMAGTRGKAGPPPRFRLDYSLADTLQSSLLTLAAVGLALFAFRGHPAASATFVMLAVLFHAVRTQAFYSHLYRERSRLQAEALHLERLATLDALTGIHNRRWFDSNVQPWLADKANYPCTLILADVDHFKQINDTHGHTVGDHVLRSVAHILQEAIAPIPGASVVRLGGDEFAAMLSNHDAEQTVSIAEGIRRSVASIGSISVLDVSVSVGAASALSFISRIDLLQSADQALYRVKANGRNGAACHTCLPGQTGTLTSLREH